MDRARSCDQNERQSWVRLQRADETVTATAVWDREALTAVWVHEEIRIFRAPVDADKPNLADRTLLRMCEEKVSRALDCLDEECRNRIEKREIGKNCKNLPMMGFLGPAEILDRVDLGWSRIAEVHVFPAADWLRRARVGEVAAPMLIEKTEQFIVVM